MSVKFQIDFKKKNSLKSQDNLQYPEEIFLQGDNGRAVILIHGLTGTPHEMKPLGILKTTRWPDFYQSARKAFIQTKDNYDLIFVSGLSVGALLSLLLAEEFPDRIAGVSCLSPTLFYDGWNAPWYQCFLPLVTWNFLKYFFYFKEDPPYGIKNKEISKLVHRYYSTASINDISGVARYGYPYFPVALLHQQNLLAKYLIRKLKDIRVPVQFIQAKDDDVTSPKNSQFIHDRIKSEIKEIILLYNSYHVITADQERDKVAEEMEKFISRISSGSMTTRKENA